MSQSEAKLLSEFRAHLQTFGIPEEYLKQDAFLTRMLRESDNSLDYAVCRILDYIDEIAHAASRRANNVREQGNMSNPPSRSNSPAPQQQEQMQQQQQQQQASRNSHAPAKQRSNSPVGGTTSIFTIL